MGNVVKYLLAALFLALELSASATTWYHGVNTPFPSAVAGDLVWITNNESMPLVLTASGTAANPITIGFTNAGSFVQSNWTSAGAIQMNGQTGITIDGCGVGHIACTNNGTTNLMQADAVGIGGNAYNLVVKNLQVLNMYNKQMQSFIPVCTNWTAFVTNGIITLTNISPVFGSFPEAFFQIMFTNSAPTGAQLNTWYWIISPSGNSFSITTNQWDTAHPIALPVSAVFAINARGRDDLREGYPFNLSGSSIMISNCVATGGDCGISYSPGDVTQSNYLVLNCTVSNCNHSVQIGMGNSNCYLTNVVLAGNYLDHWDTWDCPGNSQIHLDGFWIWNNTYDPSSFIDGVQIHDNTEGKFVGTRTTSACAFYLYNGRYQLRNLFFFNNTSIAAIPGSWGGGFVATIGSNVWVVNNLFVGGITNSALNGGRIAMGSEQAHCYNNIGIYCSGLQLLAGTSNSVASDQSGATTAFNLTNYFNNIWSDFNVWYDAGNELVQFATEYDQAPNGTSWVSGNLTGLDHWQTWSSNNRGMPTPIWNTAHADPHSSTNLPLFVGASYQPSSSDTVANATGTNLTAIANQFGIPALLKDNAGSPRLATGNWTIGPQNAASGAPVAPSFTTQPSNQIGQTNITLTLTWAVSGDSSTTYYQLISTNSGAVLSPWSPNAYWSSNSPVAQSIWVYVLATNDAQTISTSAPALIQWTNGIGTKALPSFISQPASQVAKTNSTLFFMWGLTNNGDPSGIFSQLQSTNNGAPASPWSPNLYFGTNSTTAKSGWYVLVCTNDFGSITSAPFQMTWTNGVMFSPTFAPPPQSAVGLTNTPLTFTWSTISDGSPIAYEVIATNTGTVLSSWWPVASWTINSSTVQSGWFWVLTTNDTGVVVTSAPAFYGFTNGIAGGGGGGFTNSGLILPFHF